MRSDARRGVALIVVLFLSAALTVLMYSFLREMQVEYALSTALAEEKQAEQLAWSAIEKGIATISADRATYAGPQSAWWHDPEQWYEVELADPDGKGIGVYSMIRGGEGETFYGIADEAARINLNTAPREILMRLPRVTDEIADAILDWRDADDQVTGSGAEGAYYLSLQPGYACKNGPFDTVEELLLVKGVTPEVLYGEDVNGNGVLDPAEDDADKNLPNDNADGILDPGLIAVMTVWSYDRNAQADGTPRVNINTASVEELRDALGDVLSPRQISDIPLRRPAVAAVVRAPGFRSGADLMNIPGVSPPGIDPPQYRQVADRVTVADAETIPGLVNVNTAPRRVLEAVSGWVSEDVAAVLDYRTQSDLDLSNVGWLTQVLSIEKAQAAAPWLTVRAQQFRMDALGRAGPKSTLEASSTVLETDFVSPPRVMKRFLAVFDKAAAPPRLVYWKDVSGQGMPYRVTEDFDRN
ncbi:MAG: general secretion pathway protein GspK [Planctomycetes bacterium]|nr:general secretion pathway protein GspK [Planctomycetota bacterium]